MDIRDIELGEDPAAEEDVSAVPGAGRADPHGAAVALRADPRHEAPALFQHNDIFSRNVLTFLSAPDLCRLSTCSRFCHRLSVQQHLWTHLLAVDFAPGSESLLGNDTAYMHEQVFGDYIPTERNKYKHIYRAVCGRIQRAHDQRQQQRSEETAARKAEVLQRCLDLTQFRLFSVLPGVVAVSTLILFGLKFDGATYSTWYCLAPLFFLMIYTLVGTVVSVVIHYNRSNLNSSLRSLWPKMTSPLNNIYEHGLVGKRGPQFFLFLAYIFSAAQLVFLGIKLTRDVEAMDSSIFDWGIVFLPLWLLFGMYLCAPIVWRVFNGAYVTGLLFVWLPLLILMICVAVKLNNSGDDANKLALDLVLIPFWILEGSLMLGSFVYSVAQYARYRQGLLERMDEPIGVCVTVWGAMMPFVLVQSLLSVRDHRSNSGISVIGAISPLIVVAFLGLIGCCVGAVATRTKFEIQRAERRNETAGTAVIFSI